jgi:hypothetical protein
MPPLDHLRLVQRQPRELRRLRKHLLGARGGQVEHLAVEHEHDGSCCLREAWHDTLRQLLGAMLPPGKQPLIVRQGGDR